MKCSIVAPWYRPWYLNPTAQGLYELMPRKVILDLSHLVLSPMPGLLVSLLVEAGDVVKAGEELAVIEAMKMENVIRAPRDGTVAAIHIRDGEVLEVDQTILEFEQPT